MESTNALLSFVVLAFMFAMIYKLLPDVKLAWRNVWTGAAVTAVLFTVGKTLIGLYLGRSTVGSVYGAAGSLIVVLLWIYYSAQLVLGAEFTKVYSRRFDVGPTSRRPGAGRGREGRRSRPTTAARSRSTRARATEGAGSVERHARRRPKPAGKLGCGPRSI
jgi:membrane protein